VHINNLTMLCEHGSLDTSFLAVDHFQREASDKYDGCTHTLKDPAPDRQL
jgi:hypothetical protein